MLQIGCTAVERPESFRKAKVWRDEKMIWNAGVNEEQKADLGRWH